MNNNQGGDPRYAERDSTVALKRAAARLGAVQAVYQILMGEGKIASQLIEEFVAHRLGQEFDGEKWADADIEHFTSIINGITENIDIIDKTINEALSDDWKPERLEKIMRSLLRCGTYELLFCVDIPTAVIITEYVDVAHAFYSEKEPAFVNGVLDKIARTKRG